MVLRIFKMIATSGFLTALEWTQFVFGRGSALDPTGGAYSAPPDPVAGLKGCTSKEEGRERRKEEGKGRGREGEGPAPLRKFLDPSLIGEHGKNSRMGEHCSFYKQGKDE